MAEPAAPIFLYLRPIHREALLRRAEELGVTEADAAARLIEQGLEPHLEEGSDVDQARAERQLLDVAAMLAKDQVTRATEWDERLTLLVFEQIRKEHSDLYDLASRKGRRNAVNRRLARQIKTAVGAQVKKRNGRAVTLKVPRGSQAVIGDYTLLRPPE